MAVSARDSPSRRQPNLCVGGNLEQPTFAANRKNFCTVSTQVQMTILTAIIQELAKLLYNGRGERIRTSDPLLPKQMRYQAALLPDILGTHCTAGGGPGRIRTCDLAVMSGQL